MYNYVKLFYFFKKSTVFQSESLPLPAGHGASVLEVTMLKSGWQHECVPDARPLQFVASCIQLSQYLR